MKRSMYMGPGSKGNSYDSGNENPDKPNKTRRERRREKKEDKEVRKFGRGKNRGKSKRSISTPKF